MAKKASIHDIRHPVKSPVKQGYQPFGPIKDARVKPKAKKGSKKIVYDVK